MRCAYAAIAVAVGIGVGTPPTAVAQGTASETRAGAVDSSCTGQPRPVGSVVDTIFASLRETDRHSLPDAYKAMLLRGLIQNFSVPSPLGVPVFGSGTRRRPPATAPVKHLASPHDTVQDAGHDTVVVSIAGEVSFTVQRNGRLADAALVTSSLSSSLDAQLLHAVTALDSMHAVPPLPDGTGGHSASLLFTADMLVDSASTTAPLFAARMPVWVVERDVRLKRDSPKPRYPPRAEQENIGDELLVSFVVDDHGVPRMETVRLLRATYLEFARAVLKVLPEWRFEPARIDGCPVMRRVQLPFSFKMRY